MTSQDKNGKCIWWLLVVGLVAQSYFLQELFAVFALFTVGFVAIAFLVFCLYMGTMVLRVGISWSIANITSLPLAAPSGELSDES
jgi:uncharacterized membrane protein